MTEIIPAILTDDYQDLISKLSQLEGQTSWVQLDYVDGDFAPGKTLSLEQLTEARGSYSTEIHLMTKTPEEDLGLLKDRNFDRVVVPIETLSAPEEVIKIAKQEYFEIAFALNPQTPLDKLEPWVSQLDAVLLLSVNPGKQGQPFIAETIHRVADLRRQNPHLPIEVDGGISLNLTRPLIKAGATRLVVGSAVWSSPHPLLSLQHLRREAH